MVESIADAKALKRGDVLYHSVLAFCTVAVVHGVGVDLRWEAGGRFHPQQVSWEALQRGYLLCPEGGLFSRSVHAPSALRLLVAESAPDALALLLRDLHFPQRRKDLEDWLVRRNLLLGHPFDAWWARVQRELETDRRFQVSNEWVSLLRQEGVPRLPLPLPGYDDIAALTAAFVCLNSPAREEIVGGVQEKQRSQFLGALLRLGDYEGILACLGRQDWDEDAVLEDLSPSIRERLAGGSIRDLPLVRRIGRWNMRLVAEALSFWLRDGRVVQLAGVAAELDPDDITGLVVALFEVSSEEDEAQLSRLLDLLPRAPDPNTDDSFAEWHRRYPRGLARLRPALNRSRSVCQNAAIPLRALRPLDDERWTTIVRSLARQMAASHARGQCVSGDLDQAVLLADGTVGLEAAEAVRCSGGGSEHPFCRDVREAAWFLLDLALGPLPVRERLPSSRLLAVINGVSRPPLPPALFAVLAAAVAGREPGMGTASSTGPRPAAAASEQRPTGGLDFWRRVELAAAAESVRVSAPHCPFMSFSVGCDTHVGWGKMQQGQTNQDAILPAVSDGAALLSICDGISQSTLGTGDLASSLVVRVLADWWQRQRARLVSTNGENGGGLLESALEKANTTICDVVKQLAGGEPLPQTSMGSTVAAVLAVGNQIDLLCLGDSRVYLVADWGVALLTADQNWDWARLCSLQRGEAVDWSGSGRRLVGYCGHFDPRGQPRLLEPFRRRLSMLPGERLVICSDGITDYLGSDEAEVIGAVVRSQPPQAAASSLVRLANEGGGGDNASAIVAVPVTTLPGLGGG